MATTVEDLDEIQKDGDQGQDADANPTEDEGQVEDTASQPEETPKKEDKKEEEEHHSSRKSD